MKKLIFAFAILVLILETGCNNKEQEFASMQFKNDSLAEISASKDQMMIEFVSAFNEIQANLDSIKVKEKIIGKASGTGSEIKVKMKDQINSDINLIYKLQEDSKAMIASLRSKLKKSGLQVAELDKMINNLSKQIEEKDVQIALLNTDLSKANVQVTDLKSQVVDLNSNIGNLSVQNEEKQKVIEERTTELNTAYYIVGTTDYLKEKKIVSKEGGFIGLGKTKELTPEVDKGNLTKIDVTQLDAIPIMKSKATLLTTHPKNSYRLTGKHASDSLIITDKKEFWSLSKVLVLNVK
ncbi:MAG: hypothetical protein IPH84_05545 [Bacteroidales bacterium]|nr:hypothetical protein [Bacteroidales bacterium]